MDIAKERMSYLKDRMKATVWNEAQRHKGDKYERQIKRRHDTLSEYAHIPHSMM